MTDGTADTTDSTKAVLSDREIIRPHNSAPALRPRLRIAINAITEPAPKFGARVYLWELATALARMDEVDVVMLVGEGQAKELPPTLCSHAREIPLSAGKSYWQIFGQGRIRGALVQEHPAIYHVPNTMPLLRTVVPTVVTIHDLTDLRVKKYGVLRTGYRFLANFVAAHLADRIITVSENSKRDIVHFLRIPESKVTVIYNGVGQEFRPLDRRDCKDYLASRYSITSDFLLAPGGLSRNKNIPGLLTTIRLLKETGRQEALVILGDTESPEFQHVARGIRRSGLDGTVMVPGFVPREDLPAFYNAASLVVHPTLGEGFGLPILEAMACGAPVVTSNTSSLPEVAGDAALLVDPRNPEEIAGAVQRLLSDGTLRAELSSRGIVHARQFTWTQTAEKTLEVFLEVAARKRQFQVSALKASEQ
jgi:glycosyltransferase involved in cell wall biosynthesis